MPRLSGDVALVSSEWARAPVQGAWLESSPLAGERAEKEDDVEASVRSPAGDNAKDDGLVPHGSRSVGTAGAGVKARRAMPLPLTRSRFGPNVHARMTDAATSSKFGSSAAARKRLR